MRSEPCPRCDAATVVVDCYDTRSRRFTAVELTDQQIPEQERWYFHGTRGVIHGGLIDAPAAQPFVVLHACDRTRLGSGQGAPNKSGYIGVDTEIAQRDDLPTTDDHELRIPGRVYSYRFPSHWAHIVAGADGRGLCGDRVLVPEEMTPRERARIAGMKVCPRCRGRNARDEASAGDPR